MINSRHLLLFIRQDNISRVPWLQLALVFGNSIHSFLFNSIIISSILIISSYFWDVRAPVIQLTRSYGLLKLLPDSLLQSPIEPITTFRPYYLFFLSFLCLCQCGDQEDRGCRWGRGGGIYRFVALAIVHSPNTQTQATFFPFIRSFIHSFIGDCIGNNSPLLSISHSWQHILPPPHPPTTLHPQSVISLLILLLLLFFYRRYILPPSPIDERTHARTQLSQFSVLLFLFSLFVFYFILFHFIYCVVEIGCHYAPPSPCIRRRLLLLLGVVCWCVDVGCSWDSSQWGTREYLFEFLTTSCAVLTKKLQKMSLPFSINGRHLRNSMKKKKKKKKLRYCIK